MTPDDRIIAPNNNELHLIPVVEEVGILSQKLYRLITNILEQPEDVKHIRSITNMLYDKVTLLKDNVENYDIDHEELVNTYDAPIPVDPPNDGKERIYWGPEEASQLKSEIVEEVVERLRAEGTTAAPKEEYIPEEELPVRKPSKRRNRPAQTTRTPRTPRKKAPTKREPYNFDGDK